MSISATFLANFDQFRSAVDGAITSVTGLKTTTDGVAKAADVSFAQMARSAAAVAGGVAAVSGGIALLGTRGADVADVREHFEKLTQSIGPANEVLGVLQTATLGTISKFDLMTIANTALSQGLILTKDQFQLAADAAAVLADRTGVSVKDAFETLMRAMATGQDRQLKTIGLNIDAAKAVEEYARSIGKAVKDLDEEDRKQAAVNAILQSSQSVLDQSGKAQEDFGDKVGQTSTKLRDLLDDIGVWMASTPSIGAWAAAMTAVSTSVLALATAWGPMATAFAALSGWLTPVIALIGTTLVAAFQAVLPFLGPVGWIAAGVIAVVAAWKNWDTIGPIVKGVYDAVKTWLVDRFAEVINAHKALIGLATNAFRDMYDAVVGNSYVPDMVARIAEEFGKLDAVMVDPARAAASAVEGVFSDALDAVGGQFDGLMQTSAAVQGALLLTAPTIAFHQQAVGRPSVLNLGLGPRPLEGHQYVTNITVQAQGAFFDTPASLQSLADRVGAAVLARGRL